MKRTVLQMRSVEAADHLFGRAVDITFTLYAGEVMVMTGLVNSGIHTVTRLLSGAVTEYRGQILVNGEEMRLSNARGTLQSGLVVFGQGKLYFDQFSLEDNRELFQSRGKMMRLVRAAPYPPDVLELLTLLSLPKEDGACGAFVQLKREIFLAYSAGVRVMVFSDVSICCAGTASREFNRILGFLKERGIGVLLMVLNDQMQNFEGVADSCVVIRNGMTANQLYPDSKGYFDADTVHHITVGREFVRYPLPERLGVQDEEASGAIVTLESLRTGHSLALHPGQLVGIYDEHAHIPADIEGFTAYLAQRYRVKKGGKELRLAQPGDLVKNRIAVLHHTDVERMIFPNMSPVENVSFFAQNFLDPKMLYSRAVARYIFDQVVETYPPLKRCKELRSLRDCHGLSYLNIVNLATAKWLAIHPDLVFLFSHEGNDDIKRIQWYKDLRAQLLEMGKAVVLIMSDYRLLEKEPMELFPAE